MLMKSINRILLLLVVLWTMLVYLGVTIAAAQNNNLPKVQHVIVLIQENRTPDNLFGSDLFSQPRQLPLADLSSTGKCHARPYKRQPPL